MAETDRLEEKPDLRSMLKKLSAGASYRKMLAAHEEGRPICVASAAVPIEVLYFILSSPQDLQEQMARKYLRWPPRQPPQV